MRAIRFVRKHVLPTGYFVWTIGYCLLLINQHSFALFRYDLSRQIWEGLSPYHARVALLAAFAIPLTFSFRHNRDYFGPLAFGSGLVTVLAMLREWGTIGHPELWGWEPEGRVYGVTVVAFLEFLLVIAAASLLLKRWHPTPIAVVGTLLLPALFIVQMRVVSGDGLAMKGPGQPGDGAFTYVVFGVVLAVVLFRTLRKPKETPKSEVVAPVNATQATAPGSAPAKQVDTC